MTRLVLIRHGESVSSVQRTMGGPRTCGGLSPLGRKQAEALAKGGEAEYIRVFGKKPR